MPSAHPRFASMRSQHPRVYALTRAHFAVFVRLHYAKLFIISRKLVVHADPRRFGGVLLMLQMRSGVPSSP